MAATGEPSCTCDTGGYCWACAELGRGADRGSRQPNEHGARDRRLDCTTGDGVQLIKRKGAVMAPFFFAAHQMEGARSLRWGAKTPSLAHIASLKCVASLEGNPPFGREGSPLGVALLLWLSGARRPTSVCSTAPCCIHLLLSCVSR